MTPFPMPIGSWTWLVSETMIERLGWVLLHTLWQFSLIAALTLTLLRMLRRSSASLRYAVLICTMTACVVVPVGTWFSLPTEPTGLASTAQRNVIGPVSMQPTASQGAARSETTFASDGPGVAAQLPEISDKLLVGNSRSRTESSHWWMVAADNLRPWLITIVTVWILGVMICAVRPLLSWIAIRRWRQVGTSPVSDEVSAMMLRLSERLGVWRKTEILQSSFVHVPLVFGYLRPLILLPASLLTNLPASQLEAIIAHELAHVRRHDFLLNFMQTIIETLFFYHPAIWWLSNRVRIERENCCDDLVVSILCNRVEYGKALLAVEESPGSARSLALSARDGLLLARVQRLAGLEAARSGPVASAAAMITSGLLIAGTAFMAGGLLFAAGEDNDTQFGEESHGLQVRVIPLAPEVNDESPELQKIASSFKRSEDMTFAIQLKNVSRQPISLVGIRYGEGYAAETKGKLNTAMLAPHWFEFEFTDSKGNRLLRTPQREFYKGWLSADHASVHVLAPGESLIEVLRPAKFMEPMNYDLLPGKYRVQVHYRGPDDLLRDFVRKHWPDKPILNAWPHQATSNVSDFVIDGASNRAKPTDLIWGKPVNGLQAALEYRLPDDAKGNPLVAPGIATGTPLRITFHLRNVSDKPITFVSETGRQGDRVYVTDDLGNEVEVKDAFYTGWPIDIAWKLMPGEVAQLGLLTPGLGSLVKPGQYKVRYTIRFNSRSQKDGTGNVIFPRPGDYDKEVDTGETPLFLHEANVDISAKADGTEGNANENVEPWEISKLYDAAFLRTYLQDHEALPKPIVVPAVVGKVLDPNGQPATGVNFVSYTPRQWVDLDAALTINPLNSGGVKKSKQNGTLGLPERTEPYRVLLTHESGIANVSHEELLRAHGVITLQKWASVTGTLKLDGKPQAGETIVLHFDTLPWSYSRGGPRLTTTHRTTTDKDGNFSFDRVPPLGGIAYHLSHARTLGHGTVYRCESGKSTHIEIGVGTTVTGKLQLPEHIQKSKLRVVARNHLLPIPYPKDWTDQVTQAERDSWRIKWLQTAEGYELDDKNFVLMNSSVPGSIADDGTFTIYGVPEKPMVLVVELLGEAILLEQPFDSSDASGSALNLGTVTVSDDRHHHEHRHGEVAQDGQSVDKPRLPKLIIKTVDAKGTPVRDVGVLFYDRDSQRARQKQEFEMVNKRTDESGVADFGVMPNSFGCLQLSPSNQEFARCYTLISATMTECTQAKPPRANVQTEIKDGILTVTFTMTPHVDLEFNIVDDATNEIVFWSEIFYQDPATNHWWMFGLVDGSQMQHNFIPISPQITRETIRISALGYETEIFRLPDELDRGQPIRRDIRLKPMPDVELKVLLPDGNPAEGAQLKFDYPNGVECLQIFEWKSNLQGIVTTKFPPHADIGSFRLEHPAGTAELSMQELLDEVKQSPGKVVRRNIQLRKLAAPRN